MSLRPTLRDGFAWMMESTLHKVLRLVFGILSVLASCGLFYQFAVVLDSSVPLWGIPFFTFAALALAGGILSLSGRSWLWALAGFLLAVVYVIVVIALVVLSFRYI